MLAYEHFLRFIGYNKKTICQIKLNTVTLLAHTTAAAVRSNHLFMRFFFFIVSYMCVCLVATNACTSSGVRFHHCHDADACNLISMKGFCGSVIIFIIYFIFHFSACTSTSTRIHTYMHFYELILTHLQIFCIFVTNICTQITPIFYLSSVRHPSKV